MDGLTVTYGLNVVTAVLAVLAHALAALCGWRSITRVGEVWDYPGHLGRQAWAREVGRVLGRDIPRPGQVERLAALHTALVLSAIVETIWTVLCVGQLTAVLSFEHERADWPWMLTHAAAGVRIVLFHAHAGRRLEEAGPSDA